ncbi:hypothetical protein [Pseudomonas sp. NA-150]|uniref:hypothetical protein n=1 Tax=Pseudomonas sp. NA-150 TaxID=3367525 RepID=UPI0037C962DC
MLLLSHRYLTDHQRAFAYPPEEAVVLVGRAIATGQDINGLKDLRQWLPLNRDSEVLEQIRQGKWVLLKRGSRAFNWDDFARLVQKQRANYDYTNAAANAVGTRKPSAPERSTSPVVASQTPFTAELIAVAGSQHDNGSGNKMMFVGQAVFELAMFKRYRPDRMRTLVIFTPAYTPLMLEKALKSAEGYGAAFVTVANFQELIAYLNTGHDRRQLPIEHLSLYSHGVPHRVAFGYELPADEAMSLNVLNHTQLSPSAFLATAQLDSYACRTGMGNRPDWPVEEGVQFYPQTNESLAQLLANHLRITVRAYIRRSDYKNTWGSFEQRKLAIVCGDSDDTAHGDGWCKRWVKLAKERRETDRAFDFTYQVMGAMNPVVSGNSPRVVPEGHHEFLPK